MTPSRRLHVFTAAAALAVAAAIVAGLTVLGSPAEQRRQRLDQRRVRDLSGICSEVDQYWRTNKRLPATLDEVPETSRRAGRNDPTTGLAYEYRPIGDKDFELCAIFETESPSQTDYWYTFSRNWAHGPGRHCFELSVKGAM
jgi:hypothetical protein